MVYKRNSVSYRQYKVVTEYDVAQAPVQACARLLIFSVSFSLATSSPSAFYVIKKFGQLWQKFLLLRRKANLLQNWKACTSAATKWSLQSVTQLWIVTFLSELTKSVGSLSFEE